MQLMVQSIKTAPFVKKIVEFECRGHVHIRFVSVYINSCSVRGSDPPATPSVRPHQSARYCALWAPSAEGGVTQAPAGASSTTKPGLGGEPPSKRVYRRKTWYPRIPQREGRTTGPAVRRSYDLPLSTSACSVPLAHRAGHVSVKRN